MAVGQNLYDAGWRQGSLFSGRGLVLTRNARDNETGESTLIQRSLTEEDVCVVISQDCDIISQTEDDIEALVCERIDVSKAQNLASHRRYSARYFTVEVDTGLVALAAERLLITKELLAHRGSTEWPTPTRFSRFVQWLGRRYTRPAFANELVTSFQVPVIDALAKLAKQQQHTMREFSEAVIELRIVPPESIQPPFDVELILLVTDAGLSHAAANAIDLAETAIRQAIDPQLVRIIGVTVRSDEQMSVAEYFSSSPLFLDYLTYRGTEIRGAEPLSAS